jgi:hypothetical protein
VLTIFAITFSNVDVFAKGVSSTNLPSSSLTSKTSESGYSSGSYSASSSNIPLRNLRLKLKSFILNMLVVARQKGFTGKSVIPYIIFKRELLLIIC